MGDNYEARERSRSPAGRAPPPRPEGGAAARGEDEGKLYIGNISYQARPPCLVYSRFQRISWLRYS